MAEACRLANWEYVVNALKIIFISRNLSYAALASPTDR
jgi:hypothetical protein